MALLELIKPAKGQAPFVLTPAASAKQLER